MDQQEETIVGISSSELIKYIKSGELKSDQLIQILKTRNSFNPT